MEFITHVAANTHKEVVRVRREIRKLESAKGVAIFRDTDLKEAYREYNAALYREVEKTGCHKIYIDFEMEFGMKEKVEKLVAEINTITNVSATWEGRLSSAVVVTIFNIDTKE